MMVCTSGNAVIVSDDGRMIKYKYMCPSCGHVDNQEHNCSISARVSQSCTSSCPKCRKNYGTFKFERR